MKSIILEDETLRDGLQAEKQILNTKEKVELFHLLVDAGVKRFQVGSFVHPKIVPQLADTDDLIKELNLPSSVTLTGLILNDKGLERALDCGLTHLSMSVSASDTHSLKNTNRSRREALSSMTALIQRAVSSGITVRAGIQCAFGCVYEGKIEEDLVVDILEALLAAGASEYNLADTTGMGNPRQILNLTSRTQGTFPSATPSLHLHDTRGLGLANMVAGFQAGVSIFDVATGGLGGCPCVKGAAGNVPTEDAVNLFQQMGLDTGIDLDALCLLVQRLETLFARPMPGRMFRVRQTQGACN